MYIAIMCNFQFMVLCMYMYNLPFFQDSFSAIVRSSCQVYIYTCTSESYMSEIAAVKSYLPSLFVVKNVIVDFSKSVISV